MLVAAHVELQAEMTGGGKGAKFTLKGLAPVLVLMYLEERGERSTWRDTVYGMVSLMMSIISEHTSIGENMVKKYDFHLNLVVKPKKFLEFSGITE